MEGLDKFVDLQKLAENQHSIAAAAAITITAYGIYKLLQQYGKIFSLKVGPGNMIVICDRKAVYELIDRKGSIYSDRPPMAVLYMNRLLEEPENFYTYSRLYANSVAAILAWGFRAKDTESFWFKEVNAMIEQKRAFHMRDYMDRTWGNARRLVEERRSRGDARSCMIDDKLDEYAKKGWPMSDVAFNNLFGELMEAGADTTANQILTLILALAMNPQIQVRARAELDAVCGTERAPLFSDFDKLPYINAIVKEGLRWRPTSDLGLPHTVTKGGRRICPGIHLAERSMWRIAAKLLWAFEFAEPLDPATGKVQHLDPDAYTSSNLVCPLPFKVRIKPRSETHVEIIKKEVAGAMEFLSQYD
ncbi:unnamed protein product [Parascedosporium putredinis]|uniref:Cytochrome P450 n=1 Tax=Parascedosporium putredinis TaxID=1442378 RepID=A0A9P1HBI5_9PEZI|nr:unnamed protein product [Parascedosporium putredinis]CAI8002273.1 unnamed protein product [Parascedosporium putredinis]